MYREVSMKMRLALNVLGSFALACLSFSAFRPMAWAQTIRDREQTARIVSVEKVSTTDGSVSGEVINHSKNTLRDVQLLIRYIWLWDNETKPGKNDPSTSYYYNLPGEIPPGGRATFTFKPSQPLAEASGGHFETSASIGGFSEVFLPSR
jgi:hypothetical protein